VKAIPQAACSPLTAPVSNHSVVLVERGGCNFTEKVFHVQQAGGSAAIVVDSEMRDRWAIIMFGLDQYTEKILIPSVFVSYVTGQAIERTAQELSESSNETLLVTLNETGHVEIKSTEITAVESITTYMLVGVLLCLLISALFVLVALCLSQYRKQERTKASQELKTTVFHLAKTQSDGDGGEGVEMVEQNARLVNEDSLADSLADSAEDIPVCAICLDEFAEGDVLKTLPCAHAFHDVCISPWLEGKSGLCPNCRVDALPNARLLGTDNLAMQGPLEELAELCRDHTWLFTSFFLGLLVSMWVVVNLGFRSR
jgi:E3 ubiquitin-protein ligase RNF13